MIPSYAERKKAQEWKHENRSQLKAQIRIQVATLKSLRTELAELNRLDGNILLDRFRCESPEDVEELLRSKREFLDQLADVWVSAEYGRKAS